MNSKEYTFAVVLIDEFGSRNFLEKVDVKADNYDEAKMEIQELLYDKLKELYPNEKEFSWIIDDSITEEEIYLTKEVSYDTEGEVPFGIKLFAEYLSTHSNTTLANASAVLESSNKILNKLKEKGN